MKYYLREIQGIRAVANTASVKARADAEKIFEAKDILPLDLPPTIERGQHNGVQKVFEHFKVAKQLNKTFEQLSAGDILYIQIPLRDHTIFIGNVIKKLIKRQVRVCGLIHDLEILRLSSKRISVSKRLRLKAEDLGILKNLSSIAVHNESMQKYVESLGVEKDKLISLEIFDYLIDDFENHDRLKKDASKDKPLIVAGNLSKEKAEYLYKLPEDVEFNLYGINYNDDKSNVHYKGVFPPDEVPFEMDGSFGLIWDGDSINTCSGEYGSYLRINNPHKVSLYLASGIPVVIWEEAALADFVMKNRCGITIASLSELKRKLEDISEEDYEVMRANAKEISSKLRKGHYTKQFIIKSQGKA